MPDSYTREDLSETTIIMGIVAVCVFLALILLGAGMLDKKSLTQPSIQAPVTTQSDSQAPAITQPSSPVPGTGESKAP